MIWLILVALVCLALAAAIRLLPAGPANGHPYARKPALFSPAERSFLGVLDQAVGDNYRIFGKVRVADVVSVKGAHGRGAWQRAFNRISAKHFDFVLCDSKDLSVVATIELDDQSHRRRQRQARDAFLEGLCKTIHLPLIRIPARRAYAVPELREQILTALGVSEAPPTVPPEPARDPGEPVSVAEEPPGAPQSAVDTPACPKCSAPMVRRRIETRAGADHEFWSCSAHPTCRAVVPITA